MSNMHRILKALFPFSVIAKFYFLQCKKKKKSFANNQYIIDLRAFDKVSTIHSNCMLVLSRHEISSGHNSTSSDVFSA